MDGSIVQYQNQKIVTCSICKDDFYYNEYKWHWFFCMNYYKLGQLQMLYKYYYKAQNLPYNQKFSKLRSIQGYANQIMNGLHTLKQKRIQYLENKKQSTIQNTNQNTNQIQSDQNLNQIQSDQNLNQIQSDQNLNKLNIQKNKMSNEIKYNSKINKVNRLRSVQNQTLNRNQRRSVQNLNRKRNKNKKLQKPEYSYAKLVKGKRVVIVGPAKSVLQYRQHDVIEGFDLVVRLNKSLPVPESLKPSIGERTDILYNNCNISDFPGENILNVNFMIGNGVRYLRCPYPPLPDFAADIRRFQMHNRGKLPFGHIDTAYYRSIVKKMRTRPYTGMCAILDLLRHDIDSLYVTGLDFYQGGYYKAYRTISNEKILNLRKNKVHDYRPQISLLRQMAILDKRLILDKTLSDIVFRKYDRMLDDFKYMDITNTFNISTPYITYIKNNPQLNMCIVGNSDSMSLEIFNKIKKEMDIVIYVRDYGKPIPSTVKIDILVDYGYDKNELENNRYKEITQLMLLSTKYVEANRTVNRTANKLDENIRNKSILMHAGILNAYKTAMKKLGIYNVSMELFVILFFMSLFKNKIYFAGINLYNNKNQKCDKMEEYLLHKYLTRTRSHALRA